MAVSNALACGFPGKACENAPAQCLNHLKATDPRQCLLMNFGKPELEVRRVANRCYYRRSSAFICGSNSADLLSIGGYLIPSTSGGIRPGQYGIVRVKGLKPPQVGDPAVGPPRATDARE